MSDKTIFNDGLQRGATGPVKIVGVFSNQHVNHVSTLRGSKAVAVTVWAKAIMFTRQLAFIAKDEAATVAGVYRPECCHASIITFVSNRFRSKRGKSAYLLNDFAMKINIRDEFAVRPFCVLGTLLIVASIVHAQDRQCSPDDTLCVAEVAAARLSAANAKIASLTQMNADLTAIVGAKDQLIGIKNEIIANLQKMDTNSQRIDVLGREKEDIWKEQHFDDKKMIGELQKDLASCRSNQKWIAGISLVGGVYLGRKWGSGQLQNPFATNALQYQSMFVTSPEDRARQALRLK